MEANEAQELKEQAEHGEQEEEEEEFLSLPIEHEIFDCIQTQLLYKITQNKTKNN